LLSQVLPEDLNKFGMIPEFVGRIPVITSLSALTEEDLVRILVEPKNALVRQYAKLLSFDDVELEFTPDALRAIAQQALGRKSGARGLRAIIEGVMLDTMYELPSLEGVKKCVITREAVLNGEPGKKFEALMEKAGMKVIGYFTRGPRYITSNRKIESVADCQNLLIRTPQSPMTVAAFAPRASK
ncbi:MAG: hypothetical protein ABS955_15140, partial [Stenotrophomonas maltophilia]